MTHLGAETALWRARPGTLSASWPCADDGIVFDSASGDTHRLDPLSFELYLMVAERPCTFDELVAGLFDLDEAWHAHDGRHQVAHALRVLQSLHLVQGPQQ